jgi:hypothetical protein
MNVLTLVLIQATVFLGVGVALSQLQLQPLAMAATANITTPMNTSTYENKQYGFAFDYPATWHDQYAAYEAELNNVTVAKADPYSNDSQGFEQTSFRVNVSNVQKYLDSDLQVRSKTAQDYAIKRINEEKESLYQTNAGIKSATDYEESGKLLFSMENLKNTTTLIGGENATRVHYVITFEGEQKAFHMYVYLVKDAKVYELSFFSEPLTVPNTLPIADGILKSFRFN